jgi:hypothetical protein
MARRVTDEEIEQVLAFVADVPAPETVLKLKRAKDAPELKLTLASEGDQMFVVRFNVGGLQFFAAVSLEKRIRRKIAEFEQIAEDRRIPRAEWRAFALDRVQVEANEFLERIPTAIRDALILLELEVATVLARAERALVQEGEIDLSPEIDRDSIEQISKLAQDALKERLNARGPGKSGGVGAHQVVAEIVRHGGDDAKAKDVASALGITPRQLQNIRARAGFDSWAELVTYAVNLVERK